MADILIKGMKKPQNCFTCPFKFVDANVFVGCRLPNNCPLVEVPTPHGRLIDADELAIRVKSQIQSSFCNQHNATLVFAQGLKLFVENAPTVIEASEVERDG